MDTSLLVGRIRKWLGQKVAVLCNRYQYRGILIDAEESHVTLANGTSVEVSGTANNDCPTVEDPVANTDLIIPMGMIELIYQPQWSQAPLPGEKDYKATGVYGCGARSTT